MEKKKLYIPEKILDSDDYITGFGLMELTVSAVALVVAIIVGIVIYQLNENTIVAFLAGIGIVMMTVVLVRRDICNENMFHKVRLLLKNSQTQKQFKYQYKNIYEDIRYEETDNERAVIK